MKTNFKTIFTVVVVSATVSLGSCKKIHSCKCETKLSGGGFSSSTETTEAYSEKMKEKQAKSACDNTQEILEKQVKDQQNGSGLSVSVSCDLK